MKETIRKKIINIPATILASMVSLSVFSMFSIDSHAESKVKESQIEESQVEEGKLLTGALTEQEKKDSSREILSKSGLLEAEEKTVKLLIGDNSKTYKTTKGTVGEFLKENNIELKEEDLVIPSSSSELKENEEIVLIKYYERTYLETKKIKYNVEKEISMDVAYGKTKVSKKGTFGELQLQFIEKSKNGIVLEEEMVSKKVAKNPSNKKVLIGAKQVVKKKLDYKSITKKNSDLYKGDSVVTTKGEKGLKKYTYYNDGKTKQLVSSKIVKEPVTEVVEVGTKQKPKNETETVGDDVETEESKSAKTSAKYSLSSFKFNGVINENGKKFTYYSQSVLPGGGLSIPGRHVNSDGFVADGSGYIVLASNRGISKGTVIPTPFGANGKVYDICASCDSKWFDVYVK